MTMFGLLKKKKSEASKGIDWTSYQNTRQRLLALLERDLLFISKEKKQVQSAYRALKSTKNPKPLHLDIIKKRMELIHAWLLSADQEAGKKTKDVPAEITELSQLEEIVNSIISSLSKK